MRSSAIAGQLPSSMSSQRSSPPFESHVRTGSVSSTGSSSSARPAAAASSAAAARRSARRPPGRRRRSRGRATSGPACPPTSSSSMARSYGDAGRGQRRADPRSSGPAATSRWRAASATVVVSAPFTAVCEPLGAEVRDAPVAGLEPDQAGEAGGDAGRARRRRWRSRTARCRRPTAAADPPLDPPGVRARSQGLRVIPHAFVFVKLSVPNSGAAVLPIGIAPAARMRADLHRVLLDRRAVP